MRTVWREDVESAAFWGACLAVFLFCMLGGSYIVDTGREISLIQVILERTEIEKGDSQLDAFLMTGRAVTGYLGLFVPVLAALPYVRNISAEKKSRFRLFVLSRKNWNRYFREQWTVGMLTGGTILCMGVAAGHVAAACLLHIYGLGTGDFPGWGKLGEFYAGIFLYGALSVVPSIVVSIVSESVYFMLSIPFLYSYLWDLLIYASASDISRQESKISMAGQWIFWCYHRGSIFWFENGYSFSVAAVRIFGVTAGLLCLRRGAVSWYARKGGRL